MQKAMLDVCYHYEQRDQLMDVRIRSPCAGDRPKVFAAARRGGEAAETGVKVKDVRYSDAVIPLVHVVGGRPSKEAREWVRHVARNSVHSTPASAQGSRIWSVLSCTLQRYNAVQLCNTESIL
eukprot:11218271-Lingulodinium_polyedra.AAC.1